MSKCFFCGKENSMNYESYVVQVAIKPKGYPFRWVRIGTAHTECGDKEHSAGRDLQFDAWREGFLGWLRLDVKKP